MILGEIPDAVGAALDALGARRAHENPTRGWTLDVFWEAFGEAGSVGSVHPTRLNLWWRCRVTGYARPGVQRTATCSDVALRGSFLTALADVQRQFEEELAATRTRGATMKRKAERAHEARMVGVLQDAVTTLVELRAQVVALWPEAA